MSEIEIRTPNGTRVIARETDGAERDITEGVQALYDFCVASMDWGSGFLSVEDAAGIIRIAQACGFLVPDTAAGAFEDYIKSDNTGYITSGSNNLSPPTRGDARCVICNSSVWYLAEHYTPEAYAAAGLTGGGWRHSDGFLDGSHAVQLWPIRATP